ncbi:MAG TPA: MdtA/MuxA family multidrug efflux RND transporter periplasmic adaptor subunit [Stellaceae bacterium]|nr:MdtA/MuxA family multidrug efflux RND transporter periplasmic adaptor subunit [Stellaceae bacterium]
MDDQPPGSFPSPTRERDPGEGQPQRLAPHDAPPPAGPRSGRRGLVWLGLVLLIVAGLVLWLVLRAGPQTAPGGRSAATAPTPVGTATISNGDMPIVLSGLGTVTPLATVTVKTQINGQLVEVAYQEGQLVKKGDFLAQIDPRPYQVALEQAEGQLAKDQAALKNAETDLNRYKTLVAQNSIARQTADTQAALVQQDRGTVQADEAQVDTQKLNLTYCHIVAPVGGRVGLRQVDAGNYVQTSDAAGIVVITQLQPISVIFTLPEDNLPAVLRRLNAGATLTATAYDRTGTTRLDQGKLQTIDNQIDTSTGTVKLRALFDNAEQILFPNQFVNIQLLVDTLRNVSIVPTAAIQRGAPGPFVYIVKPDHTVAAQPVTLGPSDSQNSAVTKGVKAGDVVVTDGADRLKDGAKVTLVATPPAAAGDAAPPAGQQPQGKGGGKKGGQKSGQHGGQHRQNSQSGG